MPRSLGCTYTPTRPVETEADAEAELLEQVDDRVPKLVDVGVRGQVADRRGLNHGSAHRPGVVARRADRRRTRCRPDAPGAR